MKITKIEINNFRNHKHFAFETKGKTTIIEGLNALGKSNILSAVRFVITPKHKVFTDNLGVGENDTDSSIPVTAVKGEHTSVSITFEDGNTFTKTYKTTYSTTGKINGHKAVGSINGIESKNLTLWTSDLLEAFNYQPFFKRLAASSKFDEIDLMHDANYLLKIEPKTLRSVLEELGCEITDDEVFAFGFSSIKDKLTSPKFKGDAVLMRQELKRELDVVKTDYTKYENLVAQFSNIEEFKEEELNSLVTKRKELEANKNKLLNSDGDSRLDQVKLEMDKVWNDLNTSKTKYLSDIDIEINSLNSKIDIAKAEIESARNNAKRDLVVDQKRIDTELSMKKAAIESYNNSLTSLRTRLKNTKEYAANTLARKNDYAVKRVAASERTYANYITCPCCNHQFPADESDFIVFEDNRVKEIEMYDKYIRQCDFDYDKYDKDCKNLVLQGQQCKEEITKLEELIKTLEIELVNVTNEISTIDSKPIDYSEIEKMNAEIENLKAKKSDLSILESFQHKLIELEHKKLELTHEQDSVIENEVSKIDESLISVESEIENKYILRSKHQQKDEYEKLLDDVVTKLNDIESEIQQVNGFIHKRIELLNTKATNKFGMDFVMLEENLGNDGLKEVCYPVIDGVPYANLNTAKKVEVGIKFIEKVKEILENDYNIPRNDFPILADRLEGIDTIDKIRSLTNEQLICTRVSTEKEITII